MPSTLERSTLSIPRDRWFAPVLRYALWRVQREHDEYQQWNAKQQRSAPGSSPRMIESLRFSDNVSSVKFEEHIEAALYGIKIAPFRVDVLALQGDLLAMDEV
jgi:hypothetical protein